MRLLPFIVALGVFSAALAATDNTLTPLEKDQGWIQLFDGKTLNGWMTSDRQPSQRPVEDGALSPRRCGAYLLLHEKQWSNFILALDFKISKGCNTGIFFRTWPLTPRPGRDVAFNGIEIAIDDTTGAGYHDTGALYDLVKPTKHAVRPAGQWNHLVLTCDDNLIEVELNGELVTKMDLDQWPEMNRRPDGSRHKFDVAYALHPRRGYLGFQDHGADCWYKNIKIKPL